MHMRNVHPVVDNVSLSGIDNHQYGGLSSKISLKRRLDSFFFFEAAFTTLNGSINHLEGTIPTEIGLVTSPIDTVFLRKQELGRVPFSRKSVF
mmetsp:Transcript_15256/g.22399  ORF Transcript_15256/g.22399 Transcript_15256/m.22399 type:complete len:93 (+) Transcript_15256:654-932(+)